MTMLEPEFAMWGLVLILVVALLLALTFMLFHFRQTKYSNELRRVELDQSREVLEREMHRLYEKLYRDEGRWQETNHLIMDSLAKIERVEDKISRESFQPSVKYFRKTEAPKTEVDPRAVFILTPFAKSEQATFDLIRNTCSDLGLFAQRGDEEKIEGPLLAHIIEQIKKSGVIIANLNGRNPNVFYELGLAQAWGKPCLMVARFDQDIPIDLDHQQLVLYKNRRDLESQLKSALARLAFAQVIKSSSADAAQ